MTEDELLADRPAKFGQEKDEFMPGGGQWEKELRGLANSGLLEELRQPLAAASNYMGAARLLLAGLEPEQCEAALRQLANAERELLRAGGIIGGLYVGSKGTGSSLPS